MPPLPYLDFGPRSANDAAAAPVSADIKERVTVARSLRLQRCRAAAIPRAALLERARRRPIALADVGPPEFTREKLVSVDADEEHESPVKTASPVKKASALERAQVFQRLGRATGAEDGWATDMAFAGGDFEQILKEHGVRSAELAFLCNKEGLGSDHVLQRSVLHPKLHKAAKTLTPRSMLELQHRVRVGLARKVDVLRTKFTRELVELDARGVFHPDANCRRAHTRFLAAVQREVKVGDVEAACLRELLAERDAAPEQTRPNFNEKGPVTGHGLPDPSPDEMARKRAAMLTDDQVFTQFVTWHRAKEKLDRRETGRRPGPLPATASFEQSFRTLGAPDFALIGEGTHATTKPHGSSLLPFENSFVRGNRAEDRRADRDRAAAAAREAQILLEQRAEARKRARRDEAERQKVARRKAEAEVSRKAREEVLQSRDETPSRPLSRRSHGGDDHHLKRRMERVWLHLKVSTLQRLQFLAKYASVEHAPLLEQAVGLWERAASAYLRLARLRRVEARLATGELFQASDFVALVAGILGAGDPAPPPELAAPPDQDADAAAAGCDRSAAADWLAACLETYVARCSAAASEAAAVLGDTLPSCDEFAPPPKPNRSRAGSSASLQSSLGGRA